MNRISIKTQERMRRRPALRWKLVADVIAATTFFFGRFNIKGNQSMNKY